MSDVIDVGNVEEVDIGSTKLRIHTSASPYEEAQAAAILRRAGWNQTQIGRILGLTQTNVSKRLKLLELGEENVALLREGKLKLIPAYYLTSRSKGK